MATKRRSSRRRPSGRLALGLRFGAIGAAAVVLGVVLWALLRTSGSDATIEPAADFEAALTAIAADHGANEHRLRPDDPIRKVDQVFVRTWTMQLPSGEAVAGVVNEVTAEARRLGALVVESPPEGSESRRVRVDFGDEAFDLRLLHRPEPRPTSTPIATPTATPRPEPDPSARGRLAILLDDAGQSMDLVPRCSGLPAEIGVAILPFLPATTETAVAVHQSGHEVWLHLPMEPHDYPAVRPGPGAVLLSMSESEVRTTVHSALNTIPNVVGVNNHMGSRATADLRLMTWVMQELKGRGMAFIDSRTTTETVAEVAARGQGVPVTRRHVFLDNVRTARAVRAQLDEAVYRARMEGAALAIGHLNETTLAVLEAELPGLAARGADLVRPSDLVQ